MADESPKRPVKNVANRMGAFPPKQKRLDLNRPGPFLVGSFPICVSTYHTPNQKRHDPTRQPATKSESWLYYGFGCEEDEKKKGNIDTGFILFSNLETHMVNFIIYFVMSPKMMKSLKNTSEWNKQHLIFFSAYANALCKSRIPIFEKLYHQKKDLL